MKIKFKHLQKLSRNNLAVDDGSTRFHVDVPVFKVFGKVEYLRSAAGYNLVNKLYHIIYYDDNTEEYDHNEVRDQLQ